MGDSYAYPPSTLQLPWIIPSPAKGQTIRLRNLQRVSSTMAPKPVFVIVPGAWHLPETFEPTTKILAEKGYESKGVELVSTYDTGIQDFDPDVQRIRTAVQELLDDGKDVVLVMHSYGGVVGSEAAKYFLGDNENEGKKTRGKITRMVWVCAFVLPVGTSLMDGLGGNDLPWFKVEVCRLPLFLLTLLWPT